MDFSDVVVRLERGLRRELPGASAHAPIDIPVSGFRLHPIVAALDRPPRLTPTDAEVAEILRIPVAALADRLTVRATERERDGVTYTIPAFHVGDREIWGATAMVV